MVRLLRSTVIGYSIHRGAAGLDRPGPFFNFGLDESSQIFRRAALARHEIGADLLHARLHGGGVGGRERGGLKLVDNRRGWSLWREGGGPSRCVRICPPLLIL